MVISEALLKTTCFESSSRWTLGGSKDETTCKTTRLVGYIDDDIARTASKCTTRQIENQHPAKGYQSCQDPTKP